MDATLKSYKIRIDELEAELAEAEAEVAALRLLYDGEVIENNGLRRKLTRMMVDRTYLIPNVG